MIVLKNAKVVEGNGRRSGYWIIKSNIAPAIE
jgi:hypothetical protein